MVLCCFLETVLCFMTVYAEGFDSPKSEDAEKRSGLYSYKEIYDGIMITNYFGDEKIVDIPEKIDGKEVRAIGEWCFGCNESIWTVIVPDTVHTIEHDAFNLCSLRQIDLPEGLTTIGRAAFADSDLTSIYIPASVEYDHSFSIPPLLRFLLLLTAPSCRDLP